jgi:hypothetical protein
VRSRRAKGLNVAGAFLAFTLSGCIILPVPVHQTEGASGGSRANVRADSTPHIVAGQTTRLELLLALGEPDARGEHDQSFSYRTQADRGGWHWALVWAGINGPVGGAPVGDWERVERLTVRFDERGVVSDAQFEGKNCTHCRHVLTAGGSGSTAPPH